jgi:hypothetical protein
MEAVGRDAGAARAAGPVSGGGAAGVPPPARFGCWRCGVLYNDVDLVGGRWRVTAIAVGGVCELCQEEVGELLAGGGEEVGW